MERDVKSLYTTDRTYYMMVQAQEIDNRFKGEFPDSHRVEAGDILEVTKIESFTSKEQGLKGVKLTLKGGKFAHTTTVQPVGYILSPKLGLTDLIGRSKDGAVTLYFKEGIAEGSNRPMLKCSIYPNGN